MKLSFSLPQIGLAALVTALLGPRLTGRRRDAAFIGAGICGALVAKDLVNFVTGQTNGHSH
jgi:hypothetical protein